MIKLPGFPSNVIRSPFWVYGNLPYVEDYLFNTVEQVLLSGSATTKFPTQANLNVTVRLSGSASVRSVTTGNIYVGVYLASVSTTKFVATGNLTHIPAGITLEGKATTRFSTTGNLTVEGFGVRLARATLIDETEFWYFTIEPQ